MNRRRLLLAVGSPLLAILLWQHFRSPQVVIPTFINLNIGQTYEGVVRASTYPVIKNSLPPTYDDTGSGITTVSEPAVILRFTDPQHGFTLPPTKFVLISYSHNKVSTVSTSPMIDSLPFDEALTVVENLQNQFRRGGWVPWEADESEWFDLTPAGKQRLYERMFERGYYQSAELRVPGKYSMTFRLKCTEGCWTREPPYRFLVDVGVGEDFFEWWDKLTPEEKERRLPPPQYRRCNGFKAKGGLENEPVRPPMPPCKPSSASATAGGQP
jgi:hypothetical protein